MRKYSTLGWFMLEALGALEMDRTEHPVMQAWMLDAITPIDGRRGSGMSDTYTKIDHSRGIMHVSDTPFPAAGSRAGGKTARLRQMKKVFGEGHIVMHPKELEAKVPCPSCSKPTPKSELDGAYPYDCCIECYWSLGD